MILVKRIVIENTDVNKPLLKVVGRHQLNPRRKPIDILVELKGQSATVVLLARQSYRKRYGEARASAYVGEAPTLDSSFASLFEAKVDIVGSVEATRQGNLSEQTFTGGLRFRSKGKGGGSDGTWLKVTNEY